MLVRYIINILIKYVYWVVFVINSYHNTMRHVVLCVLFFFKLYTDYIGLYLFFKSRDTHLFIKYVI